MPESEYLYHMDRKLDEAREEFHRYVAQRQRESDAKSERIDQLVKDLHKVRKQLETFQEHSQSGADARQIRTVVTNTKSLIHRAINPGSPTRRLERSKAA